jgi:hypothetical protein
MKNRLTIFILALCLTAAAPAVTAAMLATGALSMTRTTAFL